MLHAHGVHEADQRVVDALWALGGDKEMLKEWTRAEEAVTGPRSEEMSAFWGDESGAEAAVEEEEVLFMEEVEVMGARVREWERARGGAEGREEEDSVERDRTTRLRRRHAVAIGGGGDDGSEWVIATPVRN